MIAIIPARGGSKGVPGKNFKELAGKPLIAYTIEAALHATGIDRVIVTTDSKEIANIAKQYGAEVPFLRPDELASDTSSAVDVYLHAVEYLMRQDNSTIESFMVLLPTAPLRGSKHIDEAIAMYKQKKPQTLLSVKEADVPPTWYMQCDEDGRMHNAGFTSNRVIANRQENDIYYIPNGAIYILDYKLLKEERTYYSKDTLAYIMSAKDSVDIDTMLDFQFAEVLMKELKENPV